MRETGTTISERVKELRRKRRLTLQELADRAGTAKSYVWEIENGRRPQPSLRMTASLAQALGVSVDDLTGLRMAQPALHPDAMRIAIEIDTALRAQPHLCGHAEFGSYTGYVELVPPPFLARSDGRGICVDICLALEVTGLWQRGIKTTGCCCGHGRLEGYIGVTDEHIPAMKALGYEVHQNPSRPGAEDSFVPKFAPPAASKSDGGR